MDRERLNAALNLMRRMPPALAENSLAGLLGAAPEISDELLNRVDQPLKVETNPNTGDKYLICEYNRDGNSYRDHKSNSYFPAFDGFLPRQAIRKMEILANNLFEIYRKLYYGDGSVSSVYFFDTDAKDTATFGACWLIHKEVPITNKDCLKVGNWDSVHVFDICPVKDKPGYYFYKLTTTVMVTMQLGGKTIGLADLSGCRTQQDHKQLKMDSTDMDKIASLHVSNMGKMLEDNELRLRNSIEKIYIDKTRAIVNGIRSYRSKNEKEWAKVVKALPKK